MKMPWENKTGLAKAATICAVTLGISLGLCGLNVVGFFVATKWVDSLSPLLFVTAYIEASGIIFSILALLALGVIAIGRVIFESLIQRGKQE